MLGIVSISLSSGFSFQVVGDVLSNRQGCYRFNLVIERLLISGRLQKRASGAYTWPVSISLLSGFSFQVSDCRSGELLDDLLFQSRYRAASHFRDNRFIGHALATHVSISLSSGFSFQGNVLSLHGSGTAAFQSRYRAASHFRSSAVRCVSKSRKFQSRYRAASHFRGAHWRGRGSEKSGFNLVIERLLISGPTASVLLAPSSSFQSRYRAASHFRAEITPRLTASSSCFNLVIERLLISGDCVGCSCGDTRSFNLVIERLLISGARRRMRNRCPLNVSISLSSGFSFQVRPRGAPNTLWLNVRTSASVHFLRDNAC